MASRLADIESILSAARKAATSSWQFYLDSAYLSLVLLQDQVPGARYFVVGTSEYGAGNDYFAETLLDEEGNMLGDFNRSSPNIKSIGRSIAIAFSLHHPDDQFCVVDLPFYVDLTSTVIDIDEVRAHVSTKAFRGIAAPF